MEAALIVGILLAYLQKTGNDQFKRDIWIGTGLAIIFSIIGAAIFQIFLGGFEGQSEKLFEGIVMIAAAAVLTWMIIWMFHSASNLRYELQEKINLAIDDGKRYTLISLAFIAVFREGIETVLFMTGISYNEAPSAIIFSGSIGILVAVVLAAAFFRGSLELDLKRFFNITSIILIFFAAGLFSHGIHEFQELGWFGSESANWNIALWSTAVILPDSEGLGAILRALFGYQDTPSLVELLSYGLYWLGIVFTFFTINTRVKNFQSISG
jgi:high-affinity iron transporter